MNTIDSIEESVRWAEKQVIAISEELTVLNIGRAKRMLVDLVTSLNETVGNVIKYRKELK